MLSHAMHVVELARHTPHAMAPLLVVCAWYVVCVCVCLAASSLHLSSVQTHAVSATLRSMKGPRQVHCRTMHQYQNVLVFGDEAV